MSLETLVYKAIATYKAAGLDCGDKLLPPAEKAAVDRIEAATGVKVTAELRELYSIVGGQEYVSPGTTGLFGRHRLYTPAKVIEHHEISCDNCIMEAPPGMTPAIPDEDYWRRELLPFAGWDAFDLCFEPDGAVREFNPHWGLRDINQVLQKDA